MGPQELLWNSAFGDVSEFAKEGAAFEVNIQAVAETVVVLADKGVLVDTERVLGLATACLEALQGHQSHFLGESERAERMLNLLLFGLQIIGRNLHRCLSNRFHCFVFANN